MGTAKHSIQRRQASRSVTRNGVGENLPTSVQKSYFMLADAERATLNSALEKYRPCQCEPILVGGEKAIKPALRLMTRYRLAIEEIKNSEAITSYTRWVEAVQVKGAEEKEVYLTFSPRFERIWLEAKKRLVDHAGQKSANMALRSQYSLRLYGWAKKYVSVGSRSISLQQLRKVLGLESVKGAAGNMIKEAPLPIWANLRQRALDVAIAEMNAKTDLDIALKSLEGSRHRRVTTLTFAIKARAVSKGKSTS